jgi:hypothetical protein
MHEVVKEYGDLDCIITPREHMSEQEYSDAMKISKAAKKKDKVSKALQDAVDDTAAEYENARDVRAEETTNVASKILELKGPLAAEDWGRIRDAIASQQLIDEKKEQISQRCEKASARLLRT